MPGTLMGVVVVIFVIGLSVVRGVGTLVCRPARGPRLSGPATPAARSMPRA
jgi:hypothetical protein